MREKVLGQEAYSCVKKIHSLKILNLKSQLCYIGPMIFLKLFSFILAWGQVLQINDSFVGTNLSNEKPTQQVCQVSVKGLNKNKINIEVRLGQAATFEVELEKKDQAYQSIVRRNDPDESVTETISAFELKDDDSAKLEISNRHKKKDGGDEIKPLLNCSLRKRQI